MNSSEYKYDVAISFAEEDLSIAEQIAESCSEIGLKPYFYKDEDSENWGEDLFGTLMDRYRDAAKFALVLISKHYVLKKWTDIERQIIQSVSRQSGSTYLLPLRLDETVLEGMTESKLYQEWRGDAHSIAMMIKEKVEQFENAKETKKSTFPAASSTKVNKQVVKKIKAGGDVRINQAQGNE